MKKLFITLFLIPALLWGANAKDIQLRQRNAGDTGWELLEVPPEDVLPVVYTPLAGGTGLTWQKNYSDTFSGDRTFTEITSGADGDVIQVQAIVSVGTVVLNFHANNAFRRVGSSSTETSIRLSSGNNDFALVMVGSVIWLIDSGGYLNNSTATVDPTANEDIADGYGPFSVWINTTDDGVFLCVDNTAATAVWVEITGAGGGGGPTVTNGAGAPATTPGALGDIYIDTTADRAYFAVGTASSADWNLNPMSVTEIRALGFFDSTNLSSTDVTTDQSTWTTPPTITAAHNGQYITLNNAAAQTPTLPDGLGDVAFTVWNKGAGNWTFSAATTLVDITNITLGSGHVVEQNKIATFIHTGSNIWQVITSTAQASVPELVPSMGFVFWDEFHPEGLNGNEDWSNFVGNGGAASTAAFADAMGVRDFRLGTNTNGYSVIYQNRSGIRIGIGELKVRARINIGDLATATDDYDIWVGLGDTRDDSAQADGVYFLYDRGTDTDWQIVTASSSTRTTTDTTIAVTEDAWITLEMVVNEAGTSVEFFINGSSVGTHTTNIPVDSGYMVGGEKSAGTADRRFYLDYFYSKWTATVAR